MNNLIKIRLHDNNETFVFPMYAHETVLGMAIEQTEREDLREEDYEVLPESAIERGEWIQHISNELENMNYHSEIDIVDAAFGFMDDENVMKYAKHLIAKLG